TSPALVTSCLPVQQPYPEPETGLGAHRRGDVRDGGSGAALSALAGTDYIVRSMRGLNCPRLAKNEAVTTMEAHGRAVVDAPASSALCVGVGPGVVSEWASCLKHPFQPVSDHDRGHGVRRAAGSSRTRQGWAATSSDSVSNRPIPAGHAEVRKPSNHRFINP